MKISDIICHRLRNQQITETTFKEPHEIVNLLVAMQAQEFAHAKWAIGLRLQEVNDEDVEKAFNTGVIIRTHLMRPTWHFVTPADIRWMLALTAPRVHAANAFMYRKLELDKRFFNRCADVLIKALQGGKHLTRTTLKSALEQRKIFADGLRLGYIMMNAELEGIICSGARQGKQFTYALLDERVSPAKTFTREEALANFTIRYFTSRGPATIQDFVYWSGLTMQDAGAGVVMLPSQFIHENIDGQKYIFIPAVSANDKKSHATFLLPDYDEYAISYKHRNAILNPDNIPGEKRDGNPVYNHTLIVDGMIAGTWKRIVKKNTAIIETNSFFPLNKRKQQAVLNAVKRYNSFVSNDSKKKMT